jgi:predicted transcriptional regulator
MALSRSTREATYNGTLRLPPDIAEQMKEIAHTNYRSMAAEVVLACNEHVEREAAKAKAKP